MLGEGLSQKGHSVRNLEVGHLKSRLIQSLTIVFDRPASFILSDLHPHWDAFSSGFTFHGDEMEVAVS